MVYPETINGIFLRQFDLAPDRIAYYYKSAGRWIPRTIRQAHVETERAGMALRRLGITAGATVAIVAQTRPEWNTCDSGILSIGGITVGVYPSSTPDQMAYILAHCEASVAILEDGAQVARFLSVREDCPNLRTLIQIDGDLEPLPDGLKGLTWAEFQALGTEACRAEEGRFRQLALEVVPDDVATYIYTSGTTGNPKGAILTHGNFYQVIQALKQTFDFRPDEVSLIYLPMAHALQRFTTYHGMELSGTGYFAESLDKVQQNFEEVHPTVLAAVPRILEKVYTRVQATVNDGPPIRRKIFDRAFQAGQDFHRVPRDGAIPLSTRLKYRLADRVVFSKIKARLGGRVDRMISGGAPLSPTISEFFHAMGILVIEGYGLTETCAPATTNTPAAFKFGTVGKPLPGTQIRIAPDGEVLIRGPGVFKGYYKNPEATAEALKDGWFHSGDIGTLDEEGFLRITDRKKDIIITSAGKNIAPQEVENKLKNHRLVSNVMLHGDRRKFCSALITIDEEEARLMLADKATPLADLIKNPRIEAEIQLAIDELNARIPSYESIKRYRILDRDFSIEDGDLTPTLKLKRRVVTQRYQDLLDGFYDEKF